MIDEISVLGLKAPQSKVVKWVYTTETLSFYSGNNLFTWCDGVIWHDKTDQAVLWCHRSQKEDSDCAFLEILGVAENIDSHINTVESMANFIIFPLFDIIMSYTGVFSLTNNISSISHELCHCQPSIISQNYNFRKVIDYGIFCLTNPYIFVNVLST